MTALLDRRARKKARTYVEVRRVAHQLFAEHGFDAVTVADVAGAADVAVQTVFNHFASKEELFFSGRDWWARGAADAVLARTPGTGAVATAHAWLEHHTLVVPRLLRRPSVSRYLDTVLASPALHRYHHELMRRGEADLADALHATWAAQLGDVAGLRVPSELLSGVLMTSARVVLTEQWRRGWAIEPCPSSAADRAVESDRVEVRHISAATFAAVLAGMAQAADQPDESFVLTRVARLEQPLQADLVTARRPRPARQRPPAPTTGSSAPSTSAPSSPAGSGSAKAV
jgi:AcrR family transcriptional regulator